MLLRKVNGLLILLVFAAVFAAAEAQEQPMKEPAAPSLTDSQKAQLKVQTQQLEILQLKFQLLQREFDDAKRDLMQTLGKLDVPGYTLDLQTLTYHPTVVPEK